MKTEVAVFGGGCFWCTEAIFKSIEGVIAVSSGYTGGHVPSPTYDDVYADTTGHAEAVKITFDPARVSYADLLDIHFATHDATQLSIKEGVVRTRYRSSIFPLNEQQHAEALKAIADMEQELSQALLTTIEPFMEWYDAEDYHQNFWEKEGQENVFCMMNIPGKLAKLREKYPKAAADSK